MAACVKSAVSGVAFTTTRQLVNPGRPEGAGCLAMKLSFEFGVRGVFCLQSGGMRMWKPPPGGRSVTQSSVTRIVCADAVPTSVAARMRPPTNNAVKLSPVRRRIEIPPSRDPARPYRHTIVRLTQSLRAFRRSFLLKIRPEGRHHGGDFARQKFRDDGAHGASGL